MILKLIMSLFNVFGDMIMGLVSFPIFPPQLATIMETLLQWMSAGVNILNFFVPLEVVAPALAFVMAVFVIRKVYHFTMWILTKIPVLGIKK